MIYAAICNDTVYGIGDTPAEAIADAQQWADRAEDFETVIIDAGQRRLIEDGQVSCQNLGIDGDNR